MHDSRAVFLFLPTRVHVLYHLPIYILEKGERGNAVFAYTLLCLLPAWIQRQTTFGMFVMVIEHTHHNMNVHKCQWT
jgi:hypothetical protein